MTLSQFSLQGLHQFIKLLDVLTLYNHNMQRELLENFIFDFCFLLNVINHSINDVNRTYDHNH